jgi:ribosomal protein S18 acetylase RimI-like enzyme
MEKVDVREFQSDDGAAVRAFWEASSIRIRPGDDDRSLAAFADRNPGLFLLALDERGLAATALGGWDGRRGWLYHVAVRPDHRRRGLGARLVRTIEERLRERGCPKVNLIVWDDNTAAMEFWKANGYARATTVEFEKNL